MSQRLLLTGPKVQRHNGAVVGPARSAARGPACNKAGHGPARGIHGSECWRDRPGFGAKLRRSTTTVQYYSILNILKIKVYDVYNVL
jgi:hypothetical protein